MGVRSRNNLVNPSIQSGLKHSAFSPVAVSFECVARWILLAVTERQ